MGRRRRLLVAGFVVVAAAAVALAAASMTGREARPAAAVHAGETPSITVELRSWVVLGRGRHLYAEIIPPEGAPPEIAGLGCVVEYWSTALREGYSCEDPERMERIARMPAGRRARPMLIAPDNRLEATYKVTPTQARILARDRVFEKRYFLLGPNSTSGLRAAFEEAGLEFPAHVLAGAGVRGEFPGVDLPAGREIPVERWAEYGLPGGGGK